ncbi:GTPase IMAP family member 8-like [Chanos chanos]|uniref:GTPase IMAP family member 8-like n=1 Tax=Chanos chanos TaxID=29144 RepID=A0A6J2VUC6_CHACN|nr:GTPase IMAP family member 8-like [Chanos chanos]
MNMEGNSNFPPEWRIVLLGASGAGKSKTGCTILGQEVFKESVTTQSEIKKGTVEGRNISVVDTPGFFGTALSDEQMKREMEKSMVLTAPGPHVFLLVVRLGRISNQERNIVKWIQENFGLEALKHTMVLFTGREKMTKSTLTDFLETEETQELIGCYGGGWHAINSKGDINYSQITKLLEKIEEMVEMNGGQHYSYEMYQETQRKIREEERERKLREEEKRRQEEEDRQRKLKELEEKLRHEEMERLRREEREQELKKKMEDQRKNREAEERKRLEEECCNRERENRRSLDKEEDKSEKHEKQNRPATVGSIKKDNISLQREVLRRQEERRREEQKRKWMEERSSCGQTSDPVSDVRIVLLGDYISGKSEAGNIILGREAFVSGLNKCRRQDGKVQGKTITVIDTPDIVPFSFTEQKAEMKKSLSMAPPGPHAFLLVIDKNQMMSYATRDFINELKENFGDEILKFTILLFTHDVWSSDFVEVLLRMDGELQSLISSCGGRYHILNTEETEDQGQVTELLKKIEGMMKKNRGQYYTNEMYQKLDEA